ncbi:hypothetical protein [Streptomyces xantholiticus]|uniref:hypothetical protein n=1 Tax=Streptomyces xantholiticus TaxID=68285 RepID=UPI001671EC12|nr:hypothetical protein [Streptomyces xantholiticus]GGW62797.1 hypothetical protein GCM10010381_54950 [Streptomyces xantholiticus]
MSLKPFVVALESDDLAMLDKLVADGRAKEREWLEQARRRAGVRSLRGSALSQARARIRTEFAELRERGKLAGTRDLVVSREVRAELKRRKMTEEYEPVPAEDARAPGRRVGTGPRHYRQFGDEATAFDARMAVRLPFSLGEQLVRATYWTSAPAVEALRAWHDLCSDGQEVMRQEAQRRGGATLLDLLCAGFARRPSADEVLNKAELQQQVVTTGDIFRAAVKRAIL